MVAPVPTPRPTAEPARGVLRLVILLWGVGGVAVTLVEAIVRLGDIAIGILSTERMTTAQAVVLAVWMVAIVYVEGYRAFQKRFSPRVVARAMHLCEEPRTLFVILAPLYCMALVHATRRRLVANWLLVAGIVGLILLMRVMPPIYRAIIDAGVAVALTWGTVVMLVLFVRGLRGAVPRVPLDLPGEVANDVASTSRGLSRNVEG